MMWGITNLNQATNQLILHLGYWNFIPSILKNNHWSKHKHISYIHVWYTYDTRISFTWSIMYICMTCMWYTYTI